MIATAATAIPVFQVSRVSLEPPKVSLKGTWQFAMDPNDIGEKEGWYKHDLADTIDLPNTTDVAGKGPEQAFTNNTGGLTRRHPFEGIAWYRCKFVVPPTWNDKTVVLFVERTKKLTVYLDGGQPIDGGYGLSTSHNVSIGKITAGEHALTVCVDNRSSNWPDRVPASHMLENSTQTNWNGMLGRIELRTEAECAIEGVCASTVDHDPRKLSVKAYLDHSTEGISIHAKLFQNHRLIGESKSKGDATVIDLPQSAALWDEFHPNLCRLEVTVDGPGINSMWLGEVGLHDFRSLDGAFVINGRRTFLRGKHDACVFPLTGHPPMDVDGWIHYFTVVKEYGLNHVRFHSWCPPEAAFEAADKLGVYLQPELPFWGDPAAPGVEPFLTEEGKHILREYGNHPSFVMLSLGNEFWGPSLDPRYRMVDALRAVDKSRLYDQGSNSWFWAPQEYARTDYTVTAFAKHGEDGKIRGSYALDNKEVAGYIQSFVPGTMHTYDKAVEGKHLPLVSHEVGQYQVFPNFAEIAKYTGTLRADNFEVFKKNVTDAGLIDQAEQFRQASGHLALECYREEVEAALRTPHMDGFQLLDLQDYPGQGTALVGMLDAFMDSKGFVTPAEWRTFCSDFVPLALFPKYTWRSDETFTAGIRVANYSSSATHGSVEWEIRQNGKVLDHQILGAVDIPTGGVTSVGSINFPLSTVSTPAKVELSVTVADRTSTWPIWVYPSQQSTPPSNVTVSRSLDADTVAKLAAGGSVLLIPTPSTLTNSFSGCFTPDFWCFQMFGKANPPGTMGLLIQDKHPALAEFPTDYYTEWQWQDLVHHSQAIILDKLPGYKSIVQPIDNVFRNHRLGSIFELKVGDGKVLVCAFDLPGMPNAPEAAQLMKSLSDYAASDRFQPTREVSIADLNDILTGKTVAK